MSRLTAAIFAGFARTSAVIAGAMFLVLCATVVHAGAAELSWSYLLDSPRDAGRQGGIAPILVSTALVVGVAMATALPVGVAGACWLADPPPRFRHGARILRRSCFVLSGVPSIVFGLFGSALFCRTLGLGFSILSGGLTLACMILPWIVRTTEEGLRAVPEDLRLAGRALGLTRVERLLRIEIPSARSAIVAGAVLALARAASETAALIFTSGYVDRFPESLHDSGRTLTVHVYDLAMNVPGGAPRSNAAALVLLAALLATNALISWSSRPSKAIA